MPRKSHGLTKTPTYKSWLCMKQRCTNPKDPRWADYGGRGIEIYPPWLKFGNFLADMGERRTGTNLDRIDNDRDYTPDNCRWATPIEQQNNMRSNLLMLFRGRVLTASEWARELGIKVNTITTRLRRGWSIDRTLGADQLSQPQKES